jgi:chaperonin GroES
MEAHMKLRPLGDRCIVKRLDEQTKTAGGILIPENAKEKPMEGLVVSVGPGKVMADGKIRELAIKAGDTVLFGKYSGTEVKFDGQDYVILREDDVLGVVQG